MRTAALERFGDRTLANLFGVTRPPVPSSTRVEMPIVPPQAPPFVKQVTAMMMAGRGDELPVSAIPVGGTNPSGTSRWEKRDISDTVTASRSTSIANRRPSC